MWFWNLISSRFLSLFFLPVCVIITPNYWKALDNNTHCYSGTCGTCIFRREIYNFIGRKLKRPICVNKWKGSTKKKRTAPFCRALLCEVWRLRTVSVRRLPYDMTSKEKTLELLFSCHTSRCWYQTGNFKIFIRLD